MDKVLLTVEEAAKRLSIGRTKAYELVAKGELQTVTIGRCRRVPVDSLERLVDHLREVDSRRHPSATMGAGWSRTPPDGTDQVQP
jgi:excisionase family DNA binding protein